MNLQVIQNFCQNYYQEIPKDTFQKVGRSAIYSFSIALVLSNGQQFIKPETVKTVSINFARPLLLTSVAVTSSLVYALTTPLFNKIFGDDEIVFHRECIKYCVHLSCSYILLTHLTTFNTHSIGVAVINAIPVNLFLAEFDLLPLAVEKLDAFGITTNMATDIRNIYRMLGIDVQKNANSLYLTMFLGA